MAHRHAGQYDGTGAAHEVIDYLTSLNTAPEHGKRGQRVEYKEPSVEPVFHPDSYGCDVRMRLLALLARRFGLVFVLALAQRAESRSPYDSDTDATAAMAVDERIHEEVVRGLAARGRARVSGTFAPPSSGPTTVW